MWAALVFAYFVWGLGSPRSALLIIYYNYYFNIRKYCEDAAVISPETMLISIEVASALAAVPGPDNIFILTKSAMHGRILRLIVKLVWSLFVIVYNGDSTRLYSHFRHLNMHLLP
jgi:hypothetical protein